MFLICPPNSVIIPIYTVSHPKKEPPKIHLTYDIFFSFTDSNTGAIGIDIKFAKELAGDYQLLAYATYPKVAVIDNTGNCQLVDS